MTGGAREQAHPALPPRSRTALLLDMDGTLLDIAPTPAEVVVAPDLTATLRALRTGLGGALAVVTGRPVAQVDALLGDAPHAVAGEHGGAIRHNPGDPAERVVLPPPPEDWMREAERLTAAHPGVLLERKERGFVLHYRLAPALGNMLHDHLVALVAPDTSFALMPARMAWEVRPRAADKGTAVAALMQRPPFAGRLPVFIGDDVTDEDGITAARGLGGAGLRVDEAFGDPASVRAWLAAAAVAADGDRWPPYPTEPRGNTIV